MSAHWESAEQRNAALPPSLRLDTSCVNTDMDYVEERRRRSRSMSIARNHASLQRQFAIPTPLGSSRFSRRLSQAPASDRSSRLTENSYEKPYDGGEDGEGRIHLSWKQRIKHFTWTWFTLSMATGQIANVIYGVPFRFNGLTEIGVFFAVLNAFFFVFNCICISLRFYFHPKTLWASLTHPTESLFVAAAVISIGTICTNISAYAVPENVEHWIERSMIAMFWTYCGFALTTSCIIYLIMWSTQVYTISKMTPVWIFPAYPLLTIAPHAGILSSKIESHDCAMRLITGAFALQGIGYLLSFMIYGAFLYRLMTQKLPDPSARPGMFISVGPSAFTAAGILGLAAQVPRVIPDHFMGVGELAGTITVVMGNWMALWLWSLAIFFALVSVGAHWNCVGIRKGMGFGMAWYSFVFPNTGLAQGTFAVGKAFNVKGIQILGCVIGALLIPLWLFVFAAMIRAVFRRQILWPQMQEDRDEGMPKVEDGVAVLAKDVECASAIPYRR